MIMRFGIVLGIITVSLLGAYGAPLAAQEIPVAQQTLPENVVDLRQLANQFYEEKNHARFRDVMLKLHQQRPYNSEYMVQLVLAYALLGERRQAYNIMLTMQKQGLSFDFNNTEDSNLIRNTQVYDYINDLMIRAGEPAGVADVQFTLPANIILPEAIEWDGARNRFIIGTVRDGLILEVTPTGDSRELLRADKENGMWSVFGLAVDNENNRLWVSSAANRNFSDFSAPDIGRSALFEYDLESLKLIRRYPVPVDGMPHSLGNMSLAPNGDIYIADGSLPVIYRKAADGDKLEPVAAFEDLVSLRGIALSDNGEILYVADYEMGIMVMDLDRQLVGKLQAPETLNLGGIDGINFSKGHLTVIQNGITPQRVMRLKLDPSLIQVETIAPLAVALETFDFPNFGAVVGDDLWFFGNSQWSAGTDELKPVSVLKTGILSASELTPVDMQKFLEDRAEKSQQDDNQAKQPE
jgi:sugar lactone lactonase YvrE